MNQKTTKWTIRDRGKTAAIDRHGNYAFSVSPVDPWAVEFLDEANRGAESKVLDHVLDKAVLDQSTRTDIQSAYGFTSDAISMLTGREYDRDPRVAEAIEYLGRALRTLSCKIVTDEHANKSRTVTKDVPPQPIEEAIAETAGWDEQC